MANASIRGRLAAQWQPDTDVIVNLFIGVIERAKRDITDVEKLGSKAKPHHLQLQAEAEQFLQWCRETFKPSSHRELEGGD